MIPAVRIGIIEAWEPALRRGRVLADGAFYQFTAGDFFGPPGVQPEPGVRVEFVPAPAGVRARVARQVRVLRPEPVPAGAESP
jgi:hypothetical protein